MIMRAGQTDRAPHVHIMLPRDVDSEALRARHQCLARFGARVSAAIPALIYPPIVLLAALIARACLPTLISKVF